MQSIRGGSSRPGWMLSVLRFRCWVQSERRFAMYLVLEALKGAQVVPTKYCHLEIRYWPAYPHVPRGFCGQYWRVRVVLGNVRSHYWRCGQCRCLFLTTPADTRDTGYFLSRYWRVPENCLFTSQLGACDGRLSWCLPSLLINPEGLICV